MLQSANQVFLFITACCNDQMRILRIGASPKNVGSKTRWALLCAQKLTDPTGQRFPPVFLDPTTKITKHGSLFYRISHLYYILSTLQVSDSITTFFVFTNWLWIIKPKSGSHAGKPLTDLDFVRQLLTNSTASLLQWRASALTQKIVPPWQPAVQHFTHELQLTSSRL